MRLITKALKELVKTDPNFRKAFIISTRNNLPGLYPSREDGRVWYADKDRVYLSAMTPIAIYVCAKLVKDHGVELDTRETKQPPYIVLEARQYRSGNGQPPGAVPRRSLRARHGQSAPAHHTSRTMPRRACSILVHLLDTTFRPAAAAFCSASGWWIDSCSHSVLAPMAMA